MGKEESNSSVKIRKPENFYSDTWKALLGRMLKDNKWYEACEGLQRISRWMGSWFLRIL